MPLRLITCGLPGASSVMVTEPAAAPVAVGMKVTSIKQVALAARLAPQSLVWAKSPLAVMLVMFRVAVPVLVRVTGWTVLVELTS